MGKPGANRKEVGIIHGRNREALEATKKFLSALGLMPVDFTAEFKKAVKGTAETFPVVKTILEGKQAVVALLTGDDIAWLHPGRCDAYKSVEPALQPRQNVLFEAGLAFGLDPDQGKTILIEFQPVSRLSDLAGFRAITAANDPGFRETLKARLESLGCDVQPSDACDWEKAGDFAAALRPLPVPKRWAREVEAMSILEGQWHLEHGDEGNKTAHHKQDLRIDQDGNYYVHNRPNPEFVIARPTFDAVTQQIELVKVSLPATTQKKDKTEEPRWERLRVTRDAQGRVTEMDGTNLRTHHELHYTRRGD